MNWKKEFRKFIEEENPEYAKEIGYVDLPINVLEDFIQSLLEKQEKEMIKMIEKKRESSIEEFNNTFGNDFKLWSEYGFWIKALDDILSALKGGGKK